MINSSRRGFLLGLGSTIIAAPAIVRAASLMKIRSLEQIDEFEFGGFESTIPIGQFRELTAVTCMDFVQIYQSSPLLDILQNG